MPSEVSTSSTTGAGGSTTGGRRVVLVVAVADNGVIGVDGELPWRLPPDLRHFKEVTTGHVVVMGRRTFDSIGRPLPNRTNVVVTRQPDWSAEGVTVVGSLEAALKHAAGQGDVMVIGGGEVYAAALDLADAIELTEVHLSPEGDAFFPALQEGQWREESREAHEHEGVAFDFVRLVRA